MKTYQLRFQILTFWHCGSGRGGGMTVDAVAHKDRYGIPEMPGRTVKGLLRDAVQRAESWGHLPPGTTVLWFGSDGRKPGQESLADDQQEFDRHQTEPGLLVFDNAVIDPALSAWLRGEEEGLKQELYRHFYTTAIDAKTGAAKGGSLRGIELVMPLELFAPISVRTEADVALDQHSWTEQLRQCLPLIRSLGMARNRGLGRCQVTLEVCQ